MLKKMKAVKMKVEVGMQILKDEESSKSSSIEYKGLNQSRVLEVFYDFLDTYSEIPSEGIVQAYQNKSYLPLSDICAVYRVESSQRIGTSVKKLVSIEEDTGMIDYLENCSLIELVLSLDVYAKEYSLVHDTIQALYILFEDSIAYRFFSSHGIAPLYADIVKDTTKVDETKQFAYSATLSIHFSYWRIFTAPIQTFSKINPYIENVDSHHPITN